MTPRVRSAVLAALLCVTAGACSKDPAAAAQEYLASGDRYFAQRKFKHAIIQYRNAVQRNPASGEAHFRLGEAYERDGDGTAAARAFRRAAELHPDHVRAQIKAGQLDLLAGDFESARARAERVLERERRHVDAQILRANALAGLNDLNAAVTQIQEAVRHGARSDAWANLGALQLARGEREEAERAFRRAVSLAPYSVPARLALANFYWTTGRPDEAERHLHEALDSTRHHPDIDRALAFFYLSTGRAPRAEAHLVRAMKTANDAASKLALADYYRAVDRDADAVALLEGLASSDRDAAPEAVARIASIHLANGRIAEAGQRVDALLASQPDNPTALLARAPVLLAKRRPEEALDVTRRVVRADPDSFPARLWLARAQTANGAFDEARASYDALLTVRPSFVPGMLELAQLHLDAGAGGEALALTGRALELQPDDADALVMHAEALHAAGQRAEAVKVLREAAVRDPDSASLQARIASAYVAIGDTAAARAAYARALRIDPDDPVVANNLAWLIARSGEDLDTALALAQRAHAALGDLAEVNDTLGWIYHQKGMPEAALPFLRASVEKQPENPKYRLHLGLAFAESGDERGACQALREALRLDASFEGASEARAAIERLEHCTALARAAAPGAS